MIDEKEAKYLVKKVSVAPPGCDKPEKLRVMKPKIDLKICEKNYECVAYCPRNAIDITESGYPSIVNDLCDGCLICLRECPTNAISEERDR